MESVLTVAFVLATVAFFKTQFGMIQAHALLATFGVALVVGIAPQLAAAFPALLPWVESVINVIVIFLGAAGSYDLIVSLMRKNAAYND